jgi:transcriptional regulator with XRE-family HTH domain
MKKLKQNQLAEKLGVSKSYLSMIMGGKRPCPPDLAEKLQSIQGVHKVVNFQTCEVPSKQAVAGSNPVSRSNSFLLRFYSDFPFS